jgi:hypothetical protein
VEPEAVAALALTKLNTARSLSTCNLEEHQAPLTWAVTRGLLSTKMPIAPRLHPAAPTTSPPYRRSESSACGMLRLFALGAAGRIVDPPLTADGPALP